LSQSQKRSIIFDSEKSFNKSSWNGAQLFVVVDEQHCSRKDNQLFGGRVGGMLANHFQKPAVMVGAATVATLTSNVGLVWLGKSPPVWMGFLPKPFCPHR